MLGLLFFVHQAFGQESAAGQSVGAGQPMRKNVLTLSYSPVSIEGIKSSFRSSSSVRPTIIEGNYGFTAVGYNNPKYSGVFLISYGRRFAPEFETTLEGGYEQEWMEWKLYNNPARIAQRLERNHYLYFMLNPTWVFTSRKTVDLYCSLGAGARVMWNNAEQLDPRIKSVRETKFVYQLWFFGMRLRLNDRFGFTGSVGVGYLGLFRIGMFANW